MPRSVWKGPFVDYSLVKKINKWMESGSRELLKTYSRRSCIVPQFVGITISVYNGAKFIPVTITAEMIGHKLGEFAPTRVFNGHAADKKVKK